MPFPKISVVINTLNRGIELDKVLRSFSWLKYGGEFEVIVVNGPSTDNSNEVIESWLPKIRAARCDVANLSVSRNIGICMAAGEIIAFIDDDAIPEPEWLEQLAAAYSDVEVGAVGGFVYNHTGYDFQYKYCIVDRFGNADLSPPNPTPHYCFPMSEKIPHLLGCNSSFRRSALLEIGGFDEEYEYFLDETDVCLRIVDAGYVIRQLPDAYVHHKYAPSNIRGENRVPRYRYPVIKNKIYFTLKHAREFYTLDRVMLEQQRFIESQRAEVNWAVQNELLSQTDAHAFDGDVERAIKIGLDRGFEGVSPDAMITQQKIKKYAGNFLSFPVLNAVNPKAIVLVTRDFPPDHGGGIAVFNKDLAEGLAANGNIVHIVTQSLGINSVDFECGVWVHRMVIQDFELSAEARKRNVPTHIWNWSNTALQEVRRIESHRSVDVVEAPIWDCEGVAFLLDGEFPLVTSLQTTLHFWLDSHPAQRSDANWMQSFGLPMLNLEKEMMTRSQGIRAISAAIRREIELAYDFAFSDERIVIAPLGMPPDIGASSPVSENGDLTVLFVGRLEYRKGIDLLLSAVPRICKQNGRIRFRVIGDDTLTLSDGVSTFKSEFLASDENKLCLDKVVFEGRVSDDVLREAYRTCDVFVAPSRFESFGLVFLEAMRACKPVIGCIAGGMPEIISNDVNGFLVPVGDVDSLVSAIEKLSGSPELRREMGIAGQRIFNDRFTSVEMARSSVPLYELAVSNHSLDVK
jgi:hypothetical protein